MGLHRRKRRSILLPSLKEVILRNTSNPANRQLVRAINQSMVLNVVREDGPVSRAAIARETGLSQATVGSIIPALIDQGLVSEGTAEAAGVGRPPTLVDLDRDSYNVIGLKLMEDRIVGAVTDLEATTVAHRDHVIADCEVSTVVTASNSLVQDLIADAGLTKNRLLGVGVGLAGVIDTERGMCRSSPFLGWSEVPIAEKLEERLGLPVRVDNDANTLALAERWFGSGRNSDHFIVVTLGRGVGFSHVSGGTVNRGANGGAGEFGHIVVDDSEELCSCGNRGCIEAVLSEQSLLKNVSSRCTSEGLPLPVDAADMYEMACEVPAVREVLVEAAGVLARGIANIVNLFGPDLVVISGEGVDAGEVMFESLSEKIDAHVHSGLRNTFDLVIEPLRDEAWARGAASLVLDAVFESPMRATAAHAWQFDVSVAVTL